MHVFYCDDFVLPLPEKHRFPMLKYSRLRERLLAEGIVTKHEMHVPEPVTDTQILRCHDSDYVHRAKHGMLTNREVMRLGFPWSPELITRSRHSCGGTTGAGFAALRDGVAVNLAGGTHHACPDHGEGFCVFNDTAIAARILQDTGIVQRVVIIDCDVHQGNGTAAVTAGDSSVFTFSIHGEHNFPFRKIDSDLDIGLPNDTGDDAYLEVLDHGLTSALDTSQADLAIYIAGADPYEGDRLGKLSLTKQGLAAHDRMVFEACFERHIPVAVVMGGGYAPDVEDIVDIHFATVRIAAEMARKWVSIHA